MKILEAIGMLLLGWAYVVALLFGFPLAAIAVYWAIQKFFTMK